MALHDSLRGEVPSGVHFKEYVRRELIERFGKDQLYQGRFRSTRRLTSTCRRRQRRRWSSSLREIEARTARPARRGRKGTPPPTPAESGDDRLQAALIAIEPATGEVRAMVGGRDTQSVGLNRALQTKRQSGSAFKPFVYAAALESGHSPATLIDGLDIPIDTYQGAWLPEDDIPLPRR